jgi:hypothetical protein
MQCPPEVSEILAKILSVGLLRIRALGWNRDAARCAVEADHLHNLPALLAAFNPELLDFYWRVERVAFIQCSSREEIAAFEPLWAALGDHVGSNNVQAMPAR